MAGQVTNNTKGTDLDFGSVAVPESGRMKKLSLSMAWWAVCSAMFWLVVAATLAHTYGTKNAIIGLVLTVIFFGVISSIFARFVIKSGLSVALFSRILFGSTGAALATLIFFATAIYYAVFEGSVIAVAIQSTFPALDIKIAYLIVMLYSIPLVFGSVQNWLDKLNGILLPFYIIGLIAAVSLAISKFGYSSDWLSMAPESGAPATGWINCFTYYMGVAIVLLYAWDYARFGKKEDVEYHAKFNFGIPFYIFTFFINGLIGIFLAATIPTDGGISEISVVLGLLNLMGFSGLVFIWVSQTRINTANMFMALVNLESFSESTIGIHLPKFVTAIIVGALIYALMLTNVFTFILQALAYQGIFVIAWCAIALTHILSQNRTGLANNELKYKLDETPKFNLGGLTAWFAATLIGIALYQFGGSNLSVFSAPATFISAAIIYKIVLVKATPR